MGVWLYCGQEEAAAVSVLVEVVFLLISGGRC